MARTWPIARRAIRDRLNGTTIAATWEFAYDNEASGPFVEDETLTFGGGGTATLVDLTDNGTTGTMSVRMISGDAPVDDDTIAGGTSNATADVDGDPLGTKAETLTAFEYAPPGRQGVDVMPYAWLLPAEVSVVRGPTSTRELEVTALVRVVLSPGGEIDPELLQTRYDAWWLSLADRFDGFIALGGAADVVNVQDFGGLVAFEDIDRAWGFEMTLGLLISEAKTFAA